MSSTEASTSRALNDATMVEDSYSVSEDDVERPEERPGTVRSRKAPFRLFTSDSEHSTRLLQAMLLKPPFIKSAGPIHKRWMAVIDVLKQGAAQKAYLEAELRATEVTNTQEDNNPYRNVEPRTCRLAWEKFKAELKEHDKQKARKTGAVADETQWLTLIRAVVEVEELEEEKRAEAAASNTRKRSAELMEQINKDGATLRDAAMQDGPRRRGAESETDSTSTSEPRRTRPRKRRAQDHRELIELFIQRSEKQITDASRRQKERYDEATRRQEEISRSQEEISRQMMTALSKNSDQVQQLVTIQMQDRERTAEERERAKEEREREREIQMQDRELQRIERERATEERERAKDERIRQRAMEERQRTMEERQLSTNEALQAASTRQVVATEALLAFLTASKQN
ncbi:hypothetical protein BGZ65_008553 [Modicella reniformis]|uniref:Uncharacterized protein n=1 Tax=Modicella reniformis TaxID=1440133 RepID=A0A9P6JJR4_9FUNG|nr:hypothetical protein BGZ65_008553 [Modicella reniformis]